MEASDVLELAFKFRFDSLKVRMRCGASWYRPDRASGE
jgi:hypothetical protein